MAVHLLSSSSAFTKSAMSGSTTPTTPSAKLQRTEEENTDPSEPPPRPPRHSEDFDVYDTAEDVVKLIEERQSRGTYCGTVCGRRVCIDNLGWAFDAEQIRNELKQHLTGVLSITFAGSVVASTPLHCGYGCIEFDSVGNAVKGMTRLDALYLDCPGSPIPRPILSHFPEWMSSPRGERDFAGYILDHGVSPHFCQPNTLEYDVALEWRHLQRCLALSKKRLCDAFNKQICTELINYRREVDREALRSMFQNKSEGPKIRTIVCKGVSTELTNGQIRNAIEVADQCGTIRRLQCPVTERPTGTVLVEISSPERAASLVDDLIQFLFILGRSPRPADVELLEFGPPHGFEGIFDRAVESVFDVKMRLLDASKFTASHVVDISSWRNEKGRCCEKVRKLLDDMTPYRMAWKTEAEEHQQDLHKRQKEWIDEEMNKLDKLEMVVPQFFDENDR